MKNGFYYIVSGSGRIVWVYKSCGLALMDLTAMWANGSHGLMIVYNGAVLYRLGDNGIERVEIPHRVLTEEELDEAAREMGLI